MVIILKKCMFINPLALKVLIIQIKSLSLRNPFMDSSKLTELGMKDSVTFYWKINLPEERLTQHSFCKSFKNDILIMQIYVHDIIVGSANPTLCQEFSKLMQAEFEMSLMEELKFLLGSQIDQHPEATYF